MSTSSMVGSLRLLGCEHGLLHFLTLLSEFLFLLDALLLKHGLRPDELRFFDLCQLFFFLLPQAFGDGLSPLDDRLILKVLHAFPAHCFD